MQFKNNKGKSSCALNIIKIIPKKNKIKIKGKKSEAPKIRI